MGMKSKRKGAAGEREAAAELCRLFGVQCRRGRQYHGGPESPDIAAFPGLHFEVKRAETFSAYAAMDQAIEDAAESSIPAVLHRRNGREWLAVVRLENLPELATRLYLIMAQKET